MPWRQQWNMPSKSSEIVCRFVEKKTGRGLVIRRRDVQRTFLITASLRLLANVATYLAWVNPFRLFAPGEYPWSVSLADLETIVEFAEGPDIFLHYIERRLAAQLAQTETVGDEIRLFGAYLKTRLPESMFFDDDGRRLSMISFADFHLKFDDAMEFRRGERPQAPEIRLEVPRSTAMLAELRTRQKDPSSRWIAHCLLSFSNDQLGALDHILTTARERWPRPGHFGRAVCCDSGTAICVVTAADHPGWVLRDQAKRVTMLEKYRRKADRAACFAIDLRDSERPFLTALWIEGSWIPDETLDRLISEDAPTPVGKLPGVNDPCFCGSGKKFKKCCRAKLATGRR
jgi:SEC-C motif